ncbi:Na+/Pi-cotransporter [Paraliobacillus sp. PM-2]|uniref:Na/Pi symporter n=1 Tax=Paraliobacillus sp. PM-2 TaxID=1462524 RepID=UPI00061BC65D|nr:Na/Pi symporter [Paraliobacillus sp. PM-2]CQR46891.1 Na+/Pi-cotransporter [Paraliobacillus sp. PM-2]
MKLISLLFVFIMLFFIGMRLLQTGMKFYAESKLTNWISSSTNHLFGSIIIGTVATAILQSSSVVLIITISLVTVNILTFKQTIGIILGANIGTTITGELLTIGDIFPYHISLLLGIIFVFINQKKIFYIGCILLGLGNIFIAMDGFQSLMPLINDNFSLKYAFLSAQTYPEVGLLIGVIISAIIQSSSATFALTASLLHEDIISLTTSIAIMLGSNIGTCVTTLIASIRTSRQAKLVAITHTIFNIFTVLIVVPFLSLLTYIGEQLATESVNQLAHTAVIFNIFSVLIVIPFIPYLERQIRNRKKQK